MQLVHIESIIDDEARELIDTFQDKLPSHISNERCKAVIMFQNNLHHRISVMKKSLEYGSREHVK